MSAHKPQKRCAFIRRSPTVQRPGTIHALVPGHSSRGETARTRSEDARRCRGSVVVTPIAEGKAACPRCQGFMVPLTADDVDDAPFRASEQLGWRCVNCGEWIDLLIVGNRSATRDGTLTEARPRT